MDNATQWKDILIETLKGLLILAILERLMLTRHGGWCVSHTRAFLFASCILTHRPVTG